MATYKIVYFKDNKAVDMGVLAGEAQDVLPAAALFAIEQGYSAMQYTNLTTLGMGPRYHYQGGRVSPHELLGFWNAQAQAAKKICATA